MTNPTTIQKLMSEGWTIQVSEAAHEGQPFAAVDESLGIKHMVFHPMDYNYAAYPDWQTAHEVNMTRIYQKIDDRVRIALQKLDMLVDTMNAKLDPKIVHFQRGVDVEELPDGTYKFLSGSDVVYLTQARELDAEDTIMYGYHNIFSDDEDGLTYAQLREMNGGEEPTFDQLLKGAV